MASLAVTASGYSVTYTYAYDANGNITSITSGGKKTTYVYDSLNQLTRENNQAAGKTWVWTYDAGGNITSRKEYAYTTGTLGTATDTVNYTYGDSAWGDLLTAYDGVAISRDKIGNPLNDGTWTYAWDGRQLASMTSGSTTWSYKYDSDGLRTERSNGSTTYKYVYSGSSLVYMSVGSNKLYFAYDGSTPMTVTYNGTVYYYVTNLQGDVVAILDSAGTAVVQYTYDAWGNILSTTGTLASTLGTHNPLRYRGYVYDHETKLFYLQSRYYDPEIGRFINVDAYTSTGQGSVANNMFAYCLNNSVSFTDLTGHYADYYRVHEYSMAYPGYKTPILHQILNEEESVVLKADQIAFYKGVLVVRVPTGNSAAFYGIIFLGDEIKNDQSGKKTLRHEFGHYLHMQEIGWVAYTSTIAIPSLTGAGLQKLDKLPIYYYDQPWEYIADMYGEIDRGNRTTEKTFVAECYNAFTQIIGLLFF